MRAILHIGAPHIAAAAIERFIDGNRAALRDRGAIAPRSVGRVSAIGLALYALDARRRSDDRRAAGLDERGAFRRHRARLRAALIDEVEAAREERAAPPVETLIFSSDALWRSLRSRREIHRLALLLGDVADEVRVIVYLRRQDRHALSIYAAETRFGRTTPFRFPGRLSDGAFRYDRKLAAWARAFGDGAIRVRPFEAAQLAGGDLLTDFIDQAGLGGVDGFDGVSSADPAPTSAVVEFMRRINAAIPRFENGRLSPARGPIGDLAPLVESAARAPSAPETEARRFLTRFVAGDAAVARRYLGRTDGRVFFDESFAAAPDAGYLGELGADEAIAIAAQLWRLRERAYPTEDPVES